MPVKVKWFTGFKRKSGFKKELSVNANLRTMLRNTKLKNPINAYTRVAKQAQALANITKDPITKGIARKVAKEAYHELKEMKDAIKPHK